MQQIARVNVRIRIYARHVDDQDHVGDMVKCARENGEFDVRFFSFHSSFHCDVDVVYGNDWRSGQGRKLRCEFLISRMFS